MLAGKSGQHAANALLHRVPPTTVSTTTVVFVASTGEWTRRRVRDARAAHELANRLGIPSYDASLVGYPQRMRDWNARQKNGGA